jgi:hypothetical protein
MIIQRRRMIETLSVVLNGGIILAINVARPDNWIAVPALLATAACMAFVLFCTRLLPDRFSLRALLALVTGTALALGALAVALRSF